MNAPIRRLSFIVAALFASLLVSTTWIQFVTAKDLHDRPGNRRTLLASYARERGAILVGGSPVARSVPSQDQLKWLRTYPSARLYSQVTGYYSFTYGAGGGLEGAEDSLLSGQSDKLFYRRIVDMVTGKVPSGASLELTIDPRAQKAADQALGDQRGAVVALDPSTGAILAMVSHPQYDPSPLASHDLKSVAKAWQQVNNAPGNPAVNRTINGDLYPPGSTFKLVTAAAALSSGQYTEDTRIPGPATLKLPDTANATLPNDDRLPCGPGGSSTLLVALERSCNSSFGGLGMKLGADALRAQAAKFGFGDQLSVPMRVTPSTVPEQMNRPQTAQAAIGQYDVRVTPLQMAMVSAAIANKGVVMRPYLVKDVRSADLDVIEETSPEQLSQAVSPDVAARLTRMMEAVVQNGTATAAQIPGVSVAGKTGTAEHGTGLAPHAWFTAFAPADNPRIAVAVVVEDGGRAGNEAFGGKVAAPIARQVIESVVNR
ncbi:peptidoglycan D,D-transpeptidase FtsI family protein [Oryzihumus sp.]|jgi:peptidoglycan glycosyltransferase|uniref:peptidoglycan D,D-transpeptidase FtsI family protein n=1 Tax=Oryzihumus sp. TaxID=1968903 RepID=UPI002ED839BB